MSATIEHRNGKWCVIYADAVVGRHTAQFRAQQQADSLNDVVDFEDDVVVHTYTVTIYAPADHYHEGDMRADVKRAIEHVVEGDVEVEAEVL